MLTKSLIASFFAAYSSKLNLCSIGGYVIIFSFTHASVDGWTRLCNRAFEAHHHPFARKTWSACMGTVWEAGSCRVQLHTKYFFSFFLHRHAWQGNWLKRLFLVVKKSFLFPCYYLAVCLVQGALFIFFLFFYPMGELLLFSCIMFKTRWRNVGLKQYLLVPWIVNCSVSIFCIKAHWNITHSKGLDVSKSE